MAYKSARDQQQRGFLPYWLRFMVVTMVLVGMTGILVLVVLPQRFVLQANLRESGISFPAGTPGFDLPDPEPIVIPELPTEPPPPGPAEILWRDLSPLLAAGMFGQALELTNDYLRERPADTGVRRERARILMALGRDSEARAALEELARDPGSREDQLALARFLRDAGELDGAILAYRALLTERPDDTATRLELSRALLWAERYEEAETELREILRRDPESDEARLELARILFWTDRPGEARVLLTGIGARSAHIWEAILLDVEIGASLAPFEPSTLIDLTSVARAQQAAARDDYVSADQWYRVALTESPTDRALWLEWIDFRQYRKEDLAGARDELVEFGDVFGLTPDLQMRLAELQAWTGMLDEAATTLDSLLVVAPDRVDAWTLRGDLYRWNGDRIAAMDAYDRALDVRPGHLGALEGREAVRQASARVVAAAEPWGVGPFFETFGDSDDYLRMDLDADGAWRGSMTAVRAAAGFRWVEGLGLDGLLTSDQGPHAEAEVAHWWREATVRTALRAGVQHLDALGTEPTLGADLEIPHAGAWALTASYDHGPAYPYTWTYESIAADVGADALVVTAYRHLGGPWTLGLSVDGASYSQSGDDNARGGGRVSLGRELSSVWRTELATSLLSFANAAPEGATRRIYWDPELYWPTTLTIGAEQRPPDGWGWNALLTGGAALIDERFTTGAEWVPQFGARAGVFRPWAGGDLALSAFYRSGRERDYSSFGVSLGLRVRRAP
jgi:tetratricopeptide (TPR) repeat protein